MRNRNLSILAVACCATIAMTATAFAQTVIDTTAVHIPLGDWIVAATPIIALVILLLVVAAIMFGEKFLPPWAQALITPAINGMMISLAANSLNAAVQAVANAEKGKELTLPVGSAVIAVAAQNFIDAAPRWIIDRLGGVEGVKKWVLSQAEDHGVILPVTSSTSQVMAQPALQAVRPQ